jgi:hypothetical protein
VRGHAHRARNDTSDYLCLLHDESSTFMRCTVELSFIIRWDDDSVFLELSVWYSTDLQATCKKAGSNLQGTGEALQASQWFWEMVDCSSTFGSSESPWQLCHQESGDDASCSSHRKVRSIRQSVGTTSLFMAWSCMCNCRTSLPNLLSYIVDSGRVMVVRWADVRFSWALSAHEALPLPCTGKFLKWWSSQVALSVYTIAQFQSQVQC